MNNLVCKLYTENPTRKAAYFSAHFREVVLTKERPSSEIIDYHFKVLVREAHGKLTIEDLAQHQVFLVSAVSQDSPVYNKKIENQYGATLDMKILRQLRSSLATPTDGPRRKNSTLSEEIEQKFIIRAHSTSIQCLISPIVGVYLIRMLEKIQRTSMFEIFSDKVAQTSDIKTKKKASKHRANDLDDFKKMTASFIHAVDTLPEKIARCEMVTNNVEELDELQFKKAISRGINSNNSKQSNESSDEEETEIPGLITDIELHMGSAVVGYILDMPEKQPRFSWINMDFLLYKKEEMRNPSESINFDDLLMDQYIIVVSDIYMRHLSSLVKPLWASIQGIHINRFSLAKDISLSRNESLENKNQNIIHESASAQQTRHIGSNYVKINEESSMSHEDKFYSIVDDSLFHSIKEKGLWSRTNLLKIIGEDGQTSPPIGFHMSTGIEGDTRLDIVMPYTFELNLNTVSLPLDLIVNGWMSAYYDAGRCLHLEDMSPRKDFFMNQETKMIYQGIDATQLVHFFYEPLQKLLKDKTHISEIAKIMSENSVFDRFTMNLAIKKAIVSAKAHPGDNELLESTFGEIKLSWEAPSKKLSCKIEDGVKCELIEDNSLLPSPVAKRPLLLFRYKPQSSDVIAFSQNLSDWNILLTTFEFKISLTRMSMLNKILSAWSNVLILTFTSTSELVQAFSKTMSEFDSVYNHFAGESEVYTDVKQAVRLNTLKCESRSLNLLLKHLIVAVEDDTCKIMRQYFMSKTQPVPVTDDDWFVAGSSGVIPLKDELKRKNDYWQNKIVEDKTILSLELDDIMILECAEEPEILFFSIYAGRLQDGFTSMIHEQSRGRGDVEIIHISNDLFKSKESPSSKLSLNSDTVESLGSTFYDLWQDNRLVDKMCRLKYDRHNDECVVIVSPMIIKHRSDNISLLSSVSQTLIDIGSHPLLKLAGGEQQSSKSSDKCLAKLNFNQLYIDIVDKQNYRLVIKMMDAVTKIEYASDRLNLKIDIKILQAFSTNDHQAIHHANCYHMLDSDAFCRLALATNLSIACATPNSCGETKVTITMHARDDWDAKGLEIFVNPANILVLSCVMEYFGELSKVIEKLSMGMTQDQGDSYLTNRLQGAKKVNANKQTSRDDCLYSLSNKKSVSSSEDSFEVVGEYDTSVESIKECLDCKLLDSAEGILRAQEKPTCMDPLREESKFRLRFKFSKAHIYIFCEKNYTSKQHCEVRISDLSMNLRKSSLGSLTQSRIGSETTFLLAIGGFNVMDNIQNSIFQYVLETPGHPFSFAMNMIELDIERGENDASNTMIKAKRKTSEVTENRGEGFPTPKSRKNSHGSLELSTEFDREKECKPM